MPVQDHPEFESRRAELEEKWAVTWELEFKKKPSPEELRAHPQYDAVLQEWLATHGIKDGWKPSLSRLLLEVVRVHFREPHPFLRDLILGENSVHQTRIDACSAVDALVRVDVVHGIAVAGMYAVNRAHLHAGGVLNPDTGLRNDICHLVTS